MKNVTPEEKSVIETIKERCPQENGFYDMSNFDLLKVLKEKRYKNAVTQGSYQENPSLNKEIEEQ